MMMMLVDAAITVPVNVVALTDDTDFKTRETAVAYNQAGMDLVWNFVTAAGVITQTAVTPTTGGVYDWSHIGDGMYKIEIPASGGGSINNATEGYGYFTGVCTGVLPWRGPTIQFSPAHVVNGLVTGSDKLQVDTVQVGGTSQTAGDVTAIANAIPTTAMRGTDNAALASVCTEVRLATLTDWINGGRLDLLLDAIPTTAMRGTDGAYTGTPPTVGAIADQVWDEAQSGHTSAGSFGVIASEIAAIPTTMRGTDNAALASVCTEVRLAALTDWINGGRLDLLLDAILVDTAEIGTAGAGLSNITVGAMSSASVTDIWSTDTLAESYAADGAAGTPAQILYLIQQAITEFAITSTTKTIKKVDGSTTAATETLDDATAPTSITRAT